MGYSEEARRGDPEGRFGVRFCAEGAPRASFLVFRGPAGAGFGVGPGPFWSARLGNDLSPKMASFFANDTSVIYALSVRECSKIGCREAAVATAAMRYRERVVWLGDLLPERDPNFLDLCEGHAGRLTAPHGWRLERRGARPPVVPLPG
jgi:Protein of unknown function (DUF3499)